MKNAKYRVVQFGDGPFRIQRKTLFGWKLLEWSGIFETPLDFHFYRFESVEDAKAWIKKAGEKENVEMKVFE